MQITVKTKHMESTDALHGYAEKKLAKIERYFDHILSAEIMLSMERGMHLVEVTVHANGITLRGKEKTEDMYSSIDKVIDKLERQVKKHKEKLLSRHRTPKEDTGETRVVVVEGRSRAVRVEFPVKPMSEEEAIETLEQLGYMFLLYRDVKNDRVSVIYKREMGNYAILEPVL